MMATNLLDAAPLFAEYEGLVEEAVNAADGTVDPAKLHHKLVHVAEWTDSGADYLVHLATDYGAFVLRNALALAVALDIEDGELGI